MSEKEQSHLNTVSGQRSKRTQARHLTRNKNLKHVRNN